VKRGKDLHARSELAVVTDRDFANIEDRAIKVEKHTLPQFDIGTVITEKRRLQPNCVAPSAEKLKEDFSPQLPVRLACRVQYLAEITSPVTLLHQFGIQGVVQFSSKHFLSFGLQSYAPCLCRGFRSPQPFDAGSWISASIVRSS
jgi:hypothetical protein